MTGLAKRFPEVNPRYSAYAIMTGCVGPQEAMDRDHVEWPGGCMTGFTLWIGEQWDSYDKAMGYVRDEWGKPAHFEKDQRLFDEMLERLVCEREGGG